MASPASGTPSKFAYRASWISMFVAMSCPFAVVLVWKILVGPFPHPSRARDILLFTLPLMQSASGFAGCIMPFPARSDAPRLDHCTKRFRDRDWIVRLAFNAYVFWAHEIRLCQVFRRTTYPIRRVRLSRLPAGAGGAPSRRRGSLTTLGLSCLLPRHPIFLPG